jgi:hypothetical protein
VPLLSPNQSPVFYTTGEWQTIGEKETEYHEQGSKIYNVILKTAAENFLLLKTSNFSHQLVEVQFPELKVRKIALIDTINLNQTFSARRSLNPVIFFTVYAQGLTV